MTSNEIINTANVAFSIKTFVAAMLAYFVAISLDIPKPFWAIATVYIVANPLTSSILSKSLYRLLGTLIGVIATLVIIPNFANEPVLLASTVILWVSLCTFISLLDRSPRGYVALLAGYTVLLAGLPLVDSPHNSFETVASRVEEITLGIICASFIGHMVFPSHVGNVLLSRIDGWGDRAQYLLLKTFTGEICGKESRKERYALATSAGDIRSLATLLRYDGSRYRHAVALIRTLQHRMVSMLPLLSEMEDLRQTLFQLNTPISTRILSLLNGFELSSAALNASFFRRLARIKPAETSGSWERLMLVNLTRNLQAIARIAKECSSLREAAEDEKAFRLTRSTVAHRISASAQHRDIGMALLSAMTVAICLASSTLFWAVSGWRNGMTYTQMSGVFCCLLAALDDPVPAMNKFLGVTIVCVVAAFCYSFAVLPMIDGFIPLVAALGLFLIPAGICLAVPSLAIVGMGLCINFPLLLTLQSKHTPDIW